MTLDEAIKHCNEVAEELDMKAGFETDNERYAMSGSERKQCKECAEEHRQLVEWLRELKAYDEARAEIIRKSKSGQWSEGVVYGLDKAIRIMEKHLREVNADDSN